MLMHEWIRYRKEQVKQADGEAEQAETAEAEEAAGEAEAPEEDGGEVAEAEAVEVEAAWSAPETEEPEVTVADEEVAPEAPEAIGEAEALEEPEAAEVADVEENAQGEEEEKAQAAPSNAESTLRDREAVLSSLQEELDRAGNSMKERLSQLQARQRQLPIDIEEADEDGEDEGTSRKATETRQELVQRLLDPTLTLREAALLIDVCPTTVRRYTNRGLLNCFRTPGNQRRFHLSDILEFLERRERGEV